MGGKRFRLSGQKSEAEAIAWAVGLQRELGAAIEGWAAVHERVNTPPNAQAIEAAEGPYGYERVVLVWRDHLREQLGIRDFDRPQVIDLDRLSELERAWAERSERVVRERAIAVDDHAPPTLEAALELTTRLLSDVTLNDAQRAALGTLLTAVDRVAPDMVDAHVRRSGRSGVSLTREHPTVLEVKQRYLLEQKTRIGQVEGGITPDTYNATRKHLFHGLGLSLNKSGGPLPNAPLLRLDGDIHDLDEATLKMLRDQWLDGRVKRRTAVNRLGAVAAMLDWASRDAKIEYQWPRSSRDVFRFSSRRGEARRRSRIDPYDAPTLKKLLRAASSRTRLYVLLAMNAGMYQRDIAMLTPDHLRKMEGKTYLVRLRSKEATSDQVYETAHMLWPETAELLSHETAAPNPHGRLLLTQAGTPLETTKPGKWQNNPISKAYARAVEVAKLASDPRRPQFRQLRKMGASAMFRLASEKVAKMYRGAAFEGSGNLYITVSDWAPLAVALDRWAEELRRDGVLFDGM
ncbi:MAG: hypothetical protein QM754_16405 [Tepidisphaeraceae bacterium]